MYSIANSTLALFYKQYRQIVEITMNRTDGTEYLSEADIIQGGMTVDRYCISGDKIEIGSAIAAELTLKLDNREGKFDDTNFEGAELFVRIGIKKWDAGRWENAKVEYVPIGYFTVDESPKKALSITLSALDRMVQFDKDFDADGITFPTTVGNLLTYCCTKCGVPLKTIPETLPNHSYQVKECPQRKNLTYRQIIQWIGEITATCGYIDWDGKLRMEWYSDTDTVIDKSLRYTSDMNEKDVTITGVQVEDDEENIYLAGTDEYALNIEGNALIQYDHNVIAHAVFERVNGFTYRPYTCTTKSLPHLYPMDKISYVDKKGVSHNSIVTHWVYKLNGRTHLTAKGVTATKENYAKANPLTAREAAVLAKMKKANEIELNSRQQAVLALNETIVNSLGLFMSTVEEGNGSIVYYYHNAATLEDSSVIYTFREGGFAWTDDWNDGNPIWQYGMTKDGNAVLKVLSTYKIQTEYLDAGCVTAEKRSVEYKQSVIDEISGAETRVTQSFQAADGILSSKISEKAAQADLDDLTGRVSTAESTISVQGNRIALVVDSSNSIKAASIVTAINGSASTVKISADHVDIDGIVTVGNIATADDILTEAEVTVITNNTLLTTNVVAKNLMVNAANIVGTLTASQINAEGLNVTNGTFTGSVVATNDINSESKTLINEHGIYFGNPFDQDLPSYMGDTSYSINNEGGSWLMTNIAIYYAPTITVQEIDWYSGLWYYKGWTITPDKITLRASYNDKDGTTITKNGTISASDKNVKNSIDVFSDKYDTFFDNLIPRIYKYNNDTENQLHSGYVAQEVDNAVAVAGLTREDFAAICVEYEGTPKEKWGLMYDEFISLNTWQIQKLKQRVAKLEKQLSVLEEQS